MTLLELLVEELPGRGGWPNRGILAVQDVDKWICFSALPEVEINGGEWGNNGGEWVSCIKNCEHLAEDYSKAIITREQYEAALAASKSKWDGDGLPPIGMDIEYKFTKVKYRTDFSRGKVLAYGIQNVFMEHWSSKNEFLQPLDKIEFRPIRSESDKKRDEAVFAIAELCRSSASNGHSAELIYDAIKSGKIVID
ncbi:hypothetical protein RVV06_001514 [Enterobacter ludwigii]|nr:hypothetical protein [Enterobacter ludwigii]